MMLAHGIPYEITCIIIYAQIAKQRDLRTYEYRISKGIHFRRGRNSHYARM